MYIDKKMAAYIKKWLPAAFKIKIHISKVGMWLVYNKKSGMCLVFMKKMGLGMCLVYESHYSLVLSKNG